MTVIYEDDDVPGQYDDIEGKAHFKRWTATHLGPSYFDRAFQRRRRNY